MFSQILLVLLFWINSGIPVKISPVLPKKDTPKNAVATHLPWSNDRRLTWDDFQSAADETEPLHAMTSTNIAVKANCQGNTMTFEVTCLFALSESWSKNKVSDDLLHHEQMHFDLTEVYARQLRYKLTQMKGLCTGDRSKFNAAINKIFAEWKNEQERYDTESNHGLDDVKQQYWSQQIAVRLRVLSEYQVAPQAATAGL